MWARGLWIGKHDTPGDHMMLTSTGKFRCRSVRRLEPGKRADRELFDNIVGTPWSDMAEKIVAAKASPVVPTPVPQHCTVAADGEHEVHLMQRLRATRLTSTMTPSR